MERKEVVRRDIGFCFGEFMGGSGVYIGRYTGNWRNA